MNITRFIPAAVCSLLLVGASAAFAQMTPAPEPLTGGFLGQDYAGIEAGYVNHRDGPPGVLHRYGFIGNRPMPGHENLDGLFRYNYITGSASGVDSSRHEVTAGLAGFKRNGPIAPFLEGNIGWVWSEVGRTSSDAFMYLIRTGVEIEVAPAVSITPSVAFREARHFHDRSWFFSAKAGFRLDRDWSASLAVGADDADNHNVETSIGVHRRF